MIHDRKSYSKDLGQCMKLQKFHLRKYARVDIPKNMPLICMVHTADTYIEIPIMDISVGGIKLINTNSQIDFETGAIYKDCLIDFPIIGPIKISLIARSVSGKIQMKNDRYQEVGLEFLSDTGRTTLFKISSFILKLK